jgi:hypothetical protein
MMAGFVSLAFNPAAWIVVAVVAFSGFSAGVVKGWNASNADHWRQQVEALTEAAAQTERLLRADAARAEIDRAEKERLEATIEAIAHESRLSPTACKLSVAELAQLRVLAAGRAN